jgi:hypothetical protein
VQVEGRPQQSLFLVAKIWIADHLGKNDTTLEAEDAGTGMIRARSWVEINTLQSKYPGMARLLYTLSIETKDGRYRYTLSDFRIQAHPTLAMPAPPVYNL